jgi:hypothetical protein
MKDALKFLLILIVAIVLSGMVIIGVFSIASKLNGNPSPEPAYSIVIANYPHCYIAGEEVDVKTFQAEVGLTGTDVDGTVGTKTVRATMLQNSIDDFEGEY